MGKQRGISLIQLILTLGILGFLAIMVAKVMPAYIEYLSVKKMMAAMDQGGDLKGTVRDIRAAIFELALQKQWHIRELHRELPSLEDVFVELTEGE